MLCIADFNGYFREINPAFETVLGYSPGEILSRPFMAFVHPEDREVTQQCLEKLKRGETIYSFENRYLAADGSYRWLVWTATPYIKESSIYATARDITEQKHLEEALHNSQSLTDKPLKIIPDAIFVCLIDGTLVDFQPGTFNIKALVKSEEVIGKKIESALSPQIAIKARQAIAQLLATRKTQIFEYQNVTDEKIEDYEARLLLDNEEKILIIVRDNTERKEIERLLENSREYFNNLLSSLTDVVWSVDIKKSELIYSALTAYEVQ
jgi:PAS domain S-box-containing protein